MTISLKDVGSGYKRSAINSNFQAIEDEINNNLLSKNGGVGLEAALDANSQRIINLANGVQGKDAVSLEQLNAILSANSTGIIASQLEVQYGNQAINRVFTFSNLAYVQGGNNLFVFRNGQKLGISEDYTETSTGSITLTFDPNDDDRFEFITNISLTTTLETTSSNVTHSKAGVNSPLATYLNDISLDFDTLADAVACPFLIDGDTVTLKERTSGNGGGAVWDVVLASTVTPNTYNIVQCTGVGTLALVLRVEEAVKVRQFGALGDGSNDDTAAMLSAWEYALANNAIFDTSGGYTYRLASAPSGTTATGLSCFFTTNETDNVQLRNGSSKFFVDPPASQGNVVLFESKGTDGFMFDNIIGEVPYAKAEVGDTLELLNITYATKASSNTVGNSVQGKNTGGVFHRGDLTDYATNGLDSVYRPYNTEIGQIVLDNSEMAFTLVNEYTSYGLVCACGGDNTHVGKIVVENIHRGIFLYGVKNVAVNSGKITESNATTVNIGSYGSCIDISINISVVQNSSLPTQLTRAQVHELGTSGGGSLDLENLRTHEITGLDLDLAISGSATTNESGFYLGKTTGDGSDSNIQFKDMNLTIRNTLIGASRSFVLMTEMATQNCQNVAVSGIVLNNCVVEANATIHLPPGILDDIVVNKLLGGGSLACSYGDLTTTTPPTKQQVVLNNVDLIGTISPSGVYDCPVTVRDSRIADIINIAGTTPAYNKVFINSYLGQQYIERKGRYDVYTHISDSSAMYSPDAPIPLLAAGGSISTTNSTPLNLDLTAPTDPKGTIAANLYHDTFIGNSNFVASNPYNVKILAQRSGSSGFGIATGVLVAYGVTADDFTTGTFDLEITSMINTGGQVFQASDFSISVVDADTIRFSSSREAAVMYVIVQRG